MFDKEEKTGMERLYLNEDETKEIFLMEYILNRANTSIDSLGGKQAAEQAILAWKVIEKEINSCAD